MQQPDARMATTALEGASTAIAIWRAAGLLRVTVVVKGTFAFAPGAAMTPIVAEPIAHDEEDGDPGTGLRAAGDLAPYLGQADVWLTGLAEASAGTASSLVRLGLVRRGVTLLDKTVELMIPPDAEPPIRVPIAGMGPLSRHWPIRQSLLGGLDSTRFHGEIAEIPEGFDWSYFQVAPRDQRIDGIQCGDWILFGPTERPELATCVPAACGVARLYGRAPGLRGRHIPLVPDTLRLDVDRRIASITWRGNFPVSREQELAALHVVAGIELPGRPLIWSDPYPGESASNAAVGRQEHSTAPWTNLDARPLAAPASSAALPVPSTAQREPTAPKPPFAVAVPATPFAGTHLLSDEAAARLAAAVATPFERTGGPAATPFAGTHVLSDEAAARLAATVATPFERPRAPAAPAPTPLRRPLSMSFPRPPIPAASTSAPCAGTQALSDEAATHFKAATPFEAQGAPLVASLLPGGSAPLTAMPRQARFAPPLTAPEALSVVRIPPPTRRRAGLGTSFLLAMEQHGNR